MVGVQMELDGFLERSSGVITINDVIRSPGAFLEFFLHYQGIRWPATNTTDRFTPKQFRDK